MDSITQIVLGAAVGEAVAGKKMGAKAALWGAIAGTIPDLDVFLRLLVHPIDGALLHRGFTHSILFSFAFAPILAWIVHRLYKKRYEYKLWRKLLFWALITHPMLDIFTNYGTQFLWPLQNRITFNSIFVVDPLYTVPFFLTTLVALFIRRESKLRAKINWSGIIYSCMYLVYGVILKLFILNSAPGYFAQSNVEGHRTMAGPMPLTSFYWMMMTETDSNYYIAYKSIFGDYQPEHLEKIPKNHELLDKLKWEGKNYTPILQFTANGYYSVEQRADTVFFYDLRFGTTTQMTKRVEQNPFMGYGMVVDNATVQKTISLRGKRMFDALNFDAYWNYVFSKYD